MTVRALAYPLLLVGTWIIGEPLLTPAPFTMRVVDAQTGRGVHGLRVTTDNGIVCYSLPDGTLMWGEYSLMSRDVRFTIQDERHRFDGLDTRLHVTRGARAQVTIHRSASLTH
jgi:hypothetical protein